MSHLQLTAHFNFEFLLLYYLYLMKHILFLIYKNPTSEYSSSVGSEKCEKQLCNWKEGLVEMSYSWINLVEQLNLNYDFFVIYFTP